MRALPDFAAMITSRLASLSLVALVLSGTGCAPEDEELRHGIVKLQFERGENIDANPFIGTARIEATMEYGECLVEYYSNHSNERQDGVDGEVVFGPRDLGGEGWTDRLCEDLVDSPIDCTIVSIEQRLDPPAAPQLTVVYDVAGAPDIEGRQLAIGPFPDREHAECMSGEVPEVRVGTARVSGDNSEGASVWNTETTNPNDAVVDQGKAITIYAAPS
jgi:hypothetical protein